MDKLENMDKLEDYQRDSLLINFNKLSLDDMKELVYKDRGLKLNIAENMITYGGSFVKALGECLLRADQTNLHKLIEAFPEYLIEYQPRRWNTYKKYHKLKKQL